MKLSNSFKGALRTFTYFVEWNSLHAQRCRLPSILWKRATANEGSDMTSTISHE
jgi:hypothetical protein